MINNKYIGFKWGKGIGLGIPLILILLGFPYLIKSLQAALNTESGYIYEMIQGGYFPMGIESFIGIINLPLVEMHAKVYLIILLPWLFIAKKTLVRFIFNVLIILLLIYSFFVGSNLFTFGLPFSGFATLSIDISALDSLVQDLNIGIIFLFNFSILAVMIILVAVLGTLKSLFQYLERDE